MLLVFCIKREKKLNSSVRLFAQHDVSKAAKGTHHGDEDDLRVGRLGHVLESVERSNRHGGGGRQDVGG